MIKINKILNLALVMACIFLTNNAEAKVSESLSEKFKGYILLQVEDKGKAWYINPDDGERYYMANGEVAYNMMRSFGLGTSNSDIDRVLSGDRDLLSRLCGKIILAVESHGEAYYIHPKTQIVYYLKDGAWAYKVMRNASLGITNANLDKIALGDLILKDKNDQAVMSNSLISSNILNTKLASTTIETAKPIVKNSLLDELKKIPELLIDSASASSSEIPLVAVASTTASLTLSFKGLPLAESDITELNNYWITKINALRAAKGLRQLVVDKRWVMTATEWANYMGSIDHATHSRPDGKSMHQWILTKGVWKDNDPFALRYQANGWKVNYFTENIAWAITRNTSVQAIENELDSTLAWMMSEEAYNGIHYKTIFMPDWNSVGAGFYINQKGNNMYQLYVAFHYGNLLLP